MTFFIDAERDSWRVKLQQIRMLQECGMPFCFTIRYSYAECCGWRGAPGVVEIGPMFFYARELYRRSGLGGGVSTSRDHRPRDKLDLNRLLDFDREAMLNIWRLCWKDIRLCT